MQQKPVKVHPIQFTYEIILSKGIGKLTRKSEKMMIDLAYNAINKDIYHNYPEDDKMDMLQTGIFNILNNFQNFNPDKTNNSFAYFTEIFKRGTNEAYNQLYNKKGLKRQESDGLKFFSLDRMNQGDGMFNM